LEERLYRCAEGHVYSVRVSGERADLELHEDVEAWLRSRAGGDAPGRPSGL
jgi:hypothetical protein